MGDVGIFWPLGLKPILVAASVMEGDPHRAREEGIAAAGNIEASVFQ